MGKLKFTLSNIFFWLGLVASCLVFENVSFLSSNTKGLSDTYFYMLFAFAGLCYLAYFVFDHIFNHSKFDYFLLGALGLGLTSGIIGIWCIQDFSITGIGTYSFTITDWERIRQCFSLLLFIITIYAILFTFNKNYPSFRKIWIPLVVVIAICYASIIYSLCTEMDKYVHNLNSQGIGMTSITSFFWNANMYCGMLVMGVVASIGLNYFKKNALSYISIFGFLVMNVLVGSLTSIAVSATAVLIYFLIEIIFTLKKNVKKGIIALAIYLTVIVAFVITFGSALSYDLGQFSGFCKCLFANFRGAEYPTLHLRTFTWGCTADYLKDNPLQLMFGVGFNNSGSIVGGFWKAYRGNDVGLFSTHSGYMQILVNFGVIGLSVYALFIFYYLYCFIRLVKKDARFAFLYILIGVAMFAYAVMESVILFNPNAQGIIVGILFYLPMVNKYKHLKHTTLGDDTILVEKPQIMDMELLGKSLARVFMGLIAAAVGFYIFPFIRENETLRYMVLNVVVALIIGLIFIPFIISSLTKVKNRASFYTLASMNMLLIGALTIGLTYRYYAYPGLMNENARWVVVILLLIVLVFELLLSFIYTKRTFVDYLKCYIGASKLSFMGLIGAAVVIVCVYNYLPQIELNPMILIIYPISVITMFYIFSYIIPFKDSREIFSHYNLLAIYSLKMEVIKDRLEAIDEKRRN